MKKIITAVIALGIVVLGFLCGRVLGRREGEAVALAGQISVPARVLPYLRKGDTNRVFDRFETWMDVGALAATDYRKKLWLLPNARNQLDKGIISVAQYRREYPRTIGGQLYYLIYPSDANIPPRTTNAALYQASQHYWETVRMIEKEDSNKPFEATP